MAQKSSTPLQRRGNELRSLKSNTATSGLLQRRGIKLPPIITTFHNEMAKQQVWRYKGGLLSTHTYPDADVPEVSRWSTTSSEGSTGEDASNGTNDGKSDSSNEPESPFDSTETPEERLERWRKFYSEIPREYYFDRDDHHEEYLDNLLFDRLYHEVQYTVYETDGSKYRGQEHVRFFWDDVRKQLRDDAGPVLGWPPPEELQHCTASMYGDNPLRHFQPRGRTGAGEPGKDDFLTLRTRSRSPPPRPKSPTVKRTAAGEDPELLEIREWLLNRQRQNLEL